MGRRRRSDRRCRRILYGWLATLTMEMAAVRPEALLWQGLFAVAMLLLTGGVVLRFPSASRRVLPAVSSA